MRPVIRGDIPQDPKIVRGRKFKKYEDAKPYLIEKMGPYCSYCERKLDTGLSVEHIKPKNKHSLLTLRWENFLLSCQNCNSCKADKKVKLYDYYWCHRDNTALAFEYSSGGRIRANPNLTPEQQERATKTIELTGLNRQPGSKRYKGNDSLWNQRRETWDMAKDALNDLKNQDTEGLRKSIVNNAKSKGFWSIWMTVFREDKDMLRRFIEAFPGTCQSCFDNNFNL